MRRGAAERASTDRRRRSWRVGARRLAMPEIFNLDGNTSNHLPTGLPKGVFGLTATVLNDGTVGLTGGQNSSGKSVSGSGALQSINEHFHQAAGDEECAQPSYGDTAAKTGACCWRAASTHRRRRRRSAIYNPAKKTFTLAAPLQYARQTARDSARRRQRADSRRLEFICDAGRRGLRSDHQHRRRIGQGPTRRVRWQ